MLLWAVEGILSMDFELGSLSRRSLLALKKLSSVIQSKSTMSPSWSILDLGLRHSEQISLLEKIQNSILAEQSKLIERDLKTCPNCGQKLSRNTHSKFHAVFSDHELQTKAPLLIILSVVGKSPRYLDVWHQYPSWLWKLQCEQGACSVIERHKATWTNTTPPPCE